MDHRTKTKKLKAWDYQILGRMLSTPEADVPVQQIVKDMQKAYPHTEISPKKVYNHLGKLKKLELITVGQGVRTLVPGDFLDTVRERAATEWQKLLAGAEDIRHGPHLFKSRLAIDKKGTPPYPTQRARCMVRNHFMGPMWIPSNLPNLVELERVVEQNRVDTELHCTSKVFLCVPRDLMRAYMYINPLRGYDTWVMSKFWEGVQEYTTVNDPAVPFPPFIHPRIRSTYRIRYKLRNLMDAYRIQDTPQRKDHIDHMLKCWRLTYKPAYTALNLWDTFLKTAFPDIYEALPVEAQDGVRREPGRPATKLMARGFGVVDKAPDDHVPLIALNVRDFNTSFQYRLCGANFDYVANDPDRAAELDENCFRPLLLQYQTRQANDRTEAFFRARATDTRVVPWG
jgi:hypothetical protein